MALDSGTLADAIEPRLLDLFDEMRKADEYTEKKYAKRMSEIIADEVVKHIVSTGEVTLNIRNPANDAMVAAVPLTGSGDGGANLKATFLTYMTGITDTVGTGTIS